MGRLLVLCAASGASLFVSCGVTDETGNAGEGLGQSQLACSSQTLLYLRCSSTGSNADQATQLMEIPGAPGVFELTYDVTSPRIVARGDHCLITEVRQGHGWRQHRDRRDYRSSTRPLIVPGCGALVEVKHGKRDFRVVYPHLGTYRATVDWNQRTLNIAEEAPPTVQPLLDLRVSATAATAHVIVQDVAPAAGPTVTHLPPVTEAISVSADGHALAFAPVVDPTSVDTIIQFTVPAGTAALRIEYDQLDASLPYEGVWHLEHPGATGPRRVLIHLPADAVVDRTNHVDDDPAPNELAYDLAPGETLAPFVAYRTANVPDLYDHLSTPRFQVSLPIAHRRYQPAVLALLENLDALFRSYTGQDVLRIQGIGSYPYAYPPGGWLWGGSIPLGGGLSINGFSTVNARLVPAIALPTSAGVNLMLAISAHELGNGWWGAWEEPDLTNQTPIWINSEGHSGFLRSEAELDLGYCADANREYAGLYQLFQTCPASLCPGETTVVLLTSLRAHYGWGPLQAFYAAVQDRKTFQLRGLSDVERASVVMGFFSEQVGEDLGAFFDAFQIPMTPKVRAEMATRRPAAVPIIAPPLACRQPTLRATPVPLEAWIPTGATTPVTEYVCAPGGFSASLPSTPGLTLLPATATNSCGVVTLVADPALLVPGQDAALTLTAVGLAGSPRVVPVSVTVVPNLAADPGFDAPFGNPWSEVGFIPAAGLFARDSVVLHDPAAGGASARIDSGSDNDARLVQTVTVQPNARYRLTAWVRTEGVGSGLGANLTVEWPGGGWATSPGVQGTTSWQQLSLEVSSGSATTLEIEVRLGHYGAISHGRAWFDDVRLLLLGP